MGRACNQVPDSFVEVGKRQERTAAVGAASSISTDKAITLGSSHAFWMELAAVEGEIASWPCLHEDRVSGVREEGKSLI